MDYLAYLPYCLSKEQEDLLHAAAETGSINKASKRLGRDQATLNKKWQTIRKRANLQGFNPELGLTNPVPDTHYVKGVSTYLKPNEFHNGQWVKSNVKAEELRSVAEDILAGMLDEIKPKAIIKRDRFPKKLSRKELLTVYPMGDPHIGMYAWGEECGEDFDCDIARGDLCGAVDRLVSTAEYTDEALIVNLGDFFHTDNQEGTTKRSNNRLDVDGRRQRVTTIGVEIMIYLIDTALKKHKHVTVINEVGNHDDESSFMLSLMLDIQYKKNKRVTIDMSPKTFHYHKFGKVLIGVTHGNNAKADALGQIMAVDQAENWGITEFRYWLVGHIHHISKKEVPGCVIESFRTLAAKDAYHASHGYRSGRDMVRITYHQDYGEVGREIMGIKQIRSS